MLFPNNSINVRSDLRGNASSVLLDIPINSTYTILYESYNSGSESMLANLVIDCGTTRLLNVNSFGTVPSIERFKFAKCNDDIVISISGMTPATATTTISVIYVPEDINANYLPSDSYIQIAVLLAVFGVLIFDFVRRLFSKHSH